MASPKNNTKARFLSVGLLNTAVDFSILFLLTWLGVPRAIANIFSTTAAFLTSFTANKKYTFQTTGDNLKKEMLLFTAFTLFSILVIATGVIVILTPVLDQLLQNQYWSLFFAKIASVMAGLVWNYFTYSRFVFTNKRS